MRISDWSSDVCSSDLGQPGAPLRARQHGTIGIDADVPGAVAGVQARGLQAGHLVADRDPFPARAPQFDPAREALCEQRLRPRPQRSEEHTSELQSLMRNSYAVFCLKKKNTIQTRTSYTIIHIITTAH